MDHPEERPGSVASEVDGRDGADAAPVREAVDEEETSEERSWIRIALVTGEAVLVLGLLAGWLLSEEVRTAGSLVVLFLYSFPSEFLVGLVPHEPVLLYYGQLHPAWVVALVAGVSTALAERMNYSFLSFFMDRGLFERMTEQKAVARVIDLFGRAPFWAIVVAAFTPIPFFPIRFLVVLEGYPPWRYVGAVFLARTPRFFVLAAVGRVFELPTWSLVALFVVMLVPVYISLYRHGLPGSSDDGEGAVEG